VGDRKGIWLVKMPRQQSPNFFFEVPHLSWSFISRKCQKTKGEKVVGIVVEEK